MLVMQDRVPIKWMAPEQFHKQARQQRLYSKHTEVWTFGILDWEIFSKGDTWYMFDIVFFLR